MRYILASTTYKPEKDLKNHFLFDRIISSIFVLLLISSTTYEIYMIHKNRMCFIFIYFISNNTLNLSVWTLFLFSHEIETPSELYSAFSIYKNGKKLFDTKRGHSKSIIHCLPGLRTFSMFQIMLGEWIKHNDEPYVGIQIIYTSIDQRIVNAHFWSSRHIHSDHMDMIQHIWVNNKPRSWFSSLMHAYKINI